DALARFHKLIARCDAAPLRRKMEKHLSKAIGRMNDAHEALEALQQTAETERPSLEKVKRAIRRLSKGQKDLLKKIAQHDRWPHAGVPLKPLRPKGTRRDVFSRMVRALEEDRGLIGTNYFSASEEERAAAAVNRARIRDLVTKARMSLGPDR